MNDPSRFLVIYLCVVTMHMILLQLSLRLLFRNLDLVSDCPSSHTNDLEHDAPFLAPLCQNISHTSGISIEHHEGLFHQNFFVLYRPIASVNDLCWETDDLPGDCSCQGFGGLFEGIASGAVDDGSNRFFTVGTGHGKDDDTTNLAFFICEAAMGVAAWDESDVGAGREGGGKGDCSEELEVFACLRKGRKQALLDGGRFRGGERGKRAVCGAGGRKRDEGCGQEGFYREVEDGVGEVGGRGDLRRLVVAGDVEEGGGLRGAPCGV